MVLKNFNFKICNPLTTILSPSINMKIILLKDIKNVGKKYETKEVSDGFAMNSLIPRSLALAASASALKKMEAIKAQDMSTKSGREEVLSKNLEAIEGLTITKTGKANQKGHLFASIHKEDIVDELCKQSGLKIEADHIILENR